MIDLIRRLLTRKSRIRDLIRERDEYAAHCVRLEGEMNAMWKNYPNLKVLPGHYYSPIPSVEEVRKDEERLFSNPKTIPGVDLNLEGQVALLDRLNSFYETFPFTSQRLRYSPSNPAFGGADAVFLYAMLRHVKPSKIIEVGCGHSSCLILDTNDLFLGGRTSLTFIDPNADFLHSLLANGDEHRVQIIPTRVQEIKLDTFAALDPGDILFIDSSHVSKVGSDVNYIIFDVLPSLNSGVYVHIHDIHYPFEYPREWIYEGRAWNEAYLLRAFLQYNSAFEIILFNALVSRVCEKELRNQFPTTLDRTGGIWLLKR